jgi:hypothetical protein
MDNAIGCAAAAVGAQDLQFFFQVNLNDRESKRV